jgi:hypothetical protein
MKRQKYIASWHPRIADMVANQYTLLCVFILKEGQSAVLNKDRSGHGRPHFLHLSHARVTRPRLESPLRLFDIRWVPGGWSRSSLIASVPLLSMLFGRTENELKKENGEVKVFGVGRKSIISTG